MKILRAREQSHTADLSRPARSFHRMASSPARHALFALGAAAAALSPAAAQQLPKVTITGPASVREGDRLEVTVHRTGPTTVELRGGVIFVDTASNGEFNNGVAFRIPPDSATGTVSFTAQSDGGSTDDRTITASGRTGYLTYEVGNPSSVTVMVIDVDAPVPTTNPPVFTEGEVSLERLAVTGSSERQMYPQFDPGTFHYGIGCGSGHWIET